MKGYAKHTEVWIRVADIHFYFSACPSFANHIIFSYIGVLNLKRSNTMYRWCVFDNKRQAICCRWEGKKHKEHSFFLDHHLLVMRRLGKSPSSQNQDVLGPGKVQSRTTEQIPIRKSEEEWLSIYTRKEATKGECGGVCKATNSLRRTEGSQLLTAAPVAEAREHLAEL